MSASAPYDVHRLFRAERFSALDASLSAPVSSAAGTGSPNQRPWASRQPCAARNSACTRHLDALGDGVHPERVGEGDDCIDNRTGFRILGDLAQERAVDLERLHRQQPQPRQRRPAGAEVVDREAQAAVVELAQDRADPLGLAQRGRLGQLHRQPRRVDLELLEPRGQLAGEVGAVQLARRDVEADVRLEPLLAPLEHLLGDRADHPVADRLEQAHLLGGGDEVVGVDEPAVGVVPAQQRLHRLQPAGLQLDDRLVVQDELVLGDRAPQPRRQRQPLERVLGDVGEHGRGRAAAALALVHRHVGVLEQLDRRLRVVGEQRDADAGLDVELRAGDLERLRQPRGDLVGGVARGGLALRAVGQVGQQDQELVAAEAREHARLGPSTARSHGAPAIRRSSRSPAPWPKESLTSLKLSRSTSSSATARPERAQRFTQRRSSASSWARLGSPVSGSK